MAFDSFRDFVNALDAAGELKCFSQPVATELEITEIADREMKLPGGGKTGIEDRKVTFQTKRVTSTRSSCADSTNAPSSAPKASRSG